MKNKATLRNLIVIIVLIQGFSLWSQVGINNTAPGDGSMLDITATEKGLLIPRVNINNLSTIAPVTGGSTESLLVYNTNTTTGAGFYYWDGSIWVGIDGEKDWKITGNENTVPGTNTNENFIGTSDNTDLLIARNRVERTTFETEATIQNNLGDDVDYIIKSDDQDNMFFVNGGEDQIFVRNTQHHIPTYIDPFNSYANSINDGTLTVGIQYAIAGWNQGTLGGGINGVIENITNTYAAIEGSTAAPGAAVKGLSVTNSGAYGVFGTIPTTGTWTGFGGLFTGGLGYSGGVYNVSDARVKKEINVIEGALDKIKKIDGVSYKYDYAKYSDNPIKDESIYYGFTAQNVMKQLPHAVKEKHVVVSSPDNRNLPEKQLLNVVDYTAVIPVLVEAMKEQQAQIESLQNEIIALKEK